MGKVAAIQMCSSKNVDDNLASAASLIAQAKDSGAQLIVLPEMFAVMGEAQTDKVDVKETLGHGKIQDWLAGQAQRHAVWIVSGTIPIASMHDPKRVRAASLVYNAQGQVVARYDKMHLFDVALSETEIYKESLTTEPGADLTVIDTPIGKLGVVVCYDLRFPELMRSLFNKGVEVIAVPAAFTVKTGRAHWEILVRSCAIHNFSYVVAACQSGTHIGGRTTYGHSMIVNPWGEVERVLAEGIGAVTSAVDLRRLYEIRRAIPVAEHQKIFFNKS